MGSRKINKLSKKCLWIFPTVFIYSFYFTGVVQAKNTDMQKLRNQGIYYYDVDAACSAIDTTSEDADLNSTPDVSLQDLAKKMLSNKNITYWTNNGVNTRDVVVALSEGKKAYTTADNATAKEVDLNPNILLFIINAAENGKIMVNALTDKTHTNGSNHYQGLAVDIDNGAGNTTIPLAKLVDIAKIYGGTKNDETTHYHFDFTDRTAKAPATQGDTPNSDENNLPNSLGGIRGTGLTQTEINSAKAKAKSGLSIQEGTYTGTAYGPPWDTMQGTGTTSTGIKLDKPKYVVASDPDKRLPYGSFVYITPNPFDWKGPFLVADTGGAFHGSEAKVDFYDWNGRSHQNSWGSKNVEVKKAPDVQSNSSSSNEVAPNCSCTPDDITNINAGTGAPNGTTFPNLDPSAMANAINKYIAKTNPDSKMNGLGEKIVKSAEKNNINPFIIVSIAQKETSLSNPSDYNVSHGNNSFGRTATSSQPHFVGSRTWYKWSSVEASVDVDAPENKNTNVGDIASYLRNSGFYTKALNTNNLTKVMMTYAPPFENNTNQYISQIRSWTEKMIALTKDANTNIDQISAPEIPNSACGSLNTDFPTDCAVTKPEYGSQNGVGDQFSEQQLRSTYGDPGSSGSNNGEVGKQLTEVNFLGHKVQVHKKAAACLEAVAKEIELNNITYKIKEMGCYRYDSDNGNSNIGTRSYHTYGVACDINWSTNPFIRGSSAPHDMPDSYVKAFYDHGFTWGGNWQSVKDYMHFEFNGIKPQ